MKKLFKKIAVILFIEMYLFSTMAHALVMPSIATPVGQEIASAMAARGAAPALSRVLGGLGPYGVLASILIPIVYNYVNNNDGTVTKPAGTVSVDLGQLVQNGPYWECQGGSYIGSTPLAACISKWQAYTYGSGSYQNWGAAPSSCTVSANGLFAHCYGSDGQDWDGGNTRMYASGAPVGCPTGQVGVGNVCTTPNSSATTQNTPAVTKTAKDAVADLPATEKAKPIPAQQMAEAVNKILQDDRATNGANAYNDTVANPVTATQIEALRARTGNTPKVGDLATDIGFPAPESITDPYANTPTNPSAPITPSGIDWAIPATGETIQKQTVLVSYTPTIFAAPTGCPTPIPFVMFGKSYDLPWQPACDLMATLAPLFLATGAAAAALIFASSLKS